MNRFFKQNNIFDPPAFKPNVKFSPSAGDANNNNRAKSLPTSAVKFNAPPVKTPSVVREPYQKKLSLSPPTRKAVSPPLKFEFDDDDNTSEEVVNRRDGYFIPPDYGNKFDNLPAYSKRLDFKHERDLRTHFMSELEENIMKALLKFSTNYVMGYINTKDMRMNGRFANRPLKYKNTMEHVSESRCTTCNYKFINNTRGWFLYVVILVNKPVDDPDRIQICCQKCYLFHKDAKNSYEIYPSINLLDLNYLSKEKFFYQYIFPINMVHDNETKELVINDHNCRVFEIFKNILLNFKEPNERIVSIKLSTTGGVVLKESYNNIALQRYRSMCTKPSVADDVNCYLIQEPSEMMAALKDKRLTDIKGTLYATIEVKKFYQPFDGSITFPLKMSNYCKLCKKTKMYYKNPVLYCTKCGFTDVNHFPEFDYYFEAIKTFEMHNEMIVYYDMKLYKKLTAEMNLK
ncbi:me53 [Palpita vitrealis nucleopolyhedrovirus]|uniref:Me53 n=1 Tax=Palpita vitrealis nucleopolyhedrovirus TaxID=2951960 RepID=A0AAE9LNM1_9ABAC|nr:me53 [Palpita vitrealis nucleopolyhedrovirus]